MGSGGVPNRTIIIVQGKRGDLPARGAKPNSRYDLYVNGQKVQSRWYDSEGNARRNRDFNHQDAHNNHTFPHDHKWNWDSKPPRDPQFVRPDYKNYK